MIKYISFYSKNTRAAEESSKLCIERGSYLRDLYNIAEILLSIEIIVSGLFRNTFEFIRIAWLQDYPARIALSSVRDIEFITLMPAIE